MNIVSSFVIAWCESILKSDSDIGLIITIPTIHLQMNCIISTKHHVPLTNVWHTNGLGKGHFSTDYVIDRKLTDIYNLCWRYKSCNSIHKFFCILNNNSIIQKFSVVQLTCNFLQLHPHLCHAKWQKIFRWKIYYISHLIFWGSLLCTYFWTQN